MDGREQRGREIAETKKLKRKGKLWIVPSQAGTGSYVVDPRAKECTCPDYDDRREKCKHLFAVEYTVRRESKQGGATVTETLKISYSQEWSAYNAAQTHEKEEVARLLRALCDGIPSPEQKRGRPRVPLADAVFCATMKVYASMSARRAMSDLRYLGERGYLSRVPHYNSVLNALENPGLAPLLTFLIEESAGPLRALEEDFAVDSSGFSTSLHKRWFSEKYGKEKTYGIWLKAHIMVGTLTNVVTSVEVTDKRVHDSQMMIPLLEATQQRFDVKRLSGDKGYHGSRLMCAVDARGVQPFVPFKVGSTGKAQYAPHREVWARLFHYYNYNREEFMRHYHRRSNVETTFSMIKAKFGGSVRSKTPDAQMNEVLCKVLCHNLCCLVQSMYELGVQPEFWKAS